ncbi:gamma-glutamyltransferase 7-like [Stegastes partitus]|uniref:Glutathione hydrolase n=1 Tax=Stegastes partitus TaxID=144197 RepID=A0A9Y4JTH1_9TELE|nr:PREDICTED: gamma-glutamyltransferase 7-like [Stegastes partitus]
MDVSPETKLNNQSTFSYKSFSSPQLADGSSSNDLAKKHDLNPLKQASGSPDQFDGHLSNLKETDEDCSIWDTPILISAVSIIFAAGVTIALVLQIYLGERSASIKGVLVSDHQRCTALGQRVLQDGGSSVDAAIAGALCLGVVHPHVSGVGGGGVMLVHDIHKNETRVINFQGHAPKTLGKKMLQNVSELKAGLQVGVPGMLRGLHHAHSLYGSLSWEDVVSRAADVAREGFNVSHSLSDAISKVKGDQLSQRFKDTFIPDDRVLSPGSYVQIPGLAGVLEAGLMSFYHGNLSQEIEDEVRANGGILSREDISSYIVEAEQPLEGQYNRKTTFFTQIKVPPPPSAGAALISALNLLEGIHLNENNLTESQTHRWIAEAVRAALLMADGLGKPKYNSSVAEQLSDMLSKNPTEVLLQRMNYSHTPPSEYHSTVQSLHTELLAGQVVVMGPDNLMVSVASSLNRPFGSRIITPSGIILNSLLLDFSLSNKTQGQLHTQQKNSTASEERPLLLLMPIIMVPAWGTCGIYTALSSSGGQNILHTITQVMTTALFFHKERNDSLSHPNTLLVDPESLEESEEFIHAKGHVGQERKTNSGVQGIQRRENIIKVIKARQLFDSLI